MKQIFTLIIFCCFLHLSASAQLIDFDQLETDSVTDNEGNVYPTVLFGDTWWMAANLRTKHYNDGSEMLQMTQLLGTDSHDGFYWAGAGRWAYVNFDSTTIETYGLLYTWDALINTENGGVCPEGWVLTDTADWFNLGRLIVGEDNLVYEEGERSTPDGGTETYYEISKIIGIGKYLKTDNGDLWTLEPTISRNCNQAGLNLVPAGVIGWTIDNFGEDAEYWTSNYVHADSSGQGRRYMYFSYENHNMWVSRHGRMIERCARCVKKAHLLEIGADSIVLDSVANSSCTIDITANCNWTASSKSSWLSVTQNVDSANGEIAIKTLEANTGTNRTDTVFIAIDDAETKYILVTQKGSKTSAGTEECFFRENVSVYPNPVEGYLYISSESEVQQIEVIALDGKVLDMVKLENRINMEKLPVGLYLIKISTNNGVSISKVIKQ